MAKTTDGIYKVYSIQNPPPKVFVDCSKDEPLVRQEFKAEADINNIMRRYATTGWLVDPAAPRGNRPPIFGDFTAPASTDYQAACDLVIQAQAKFDSLPVELRERFNYDPTALLAFLEDEANREEAIKLGLIPAPPAPPAPPSVVEPVTDPPKGDAAAAA